MVDEVKKIFTKQESIDFLLSEYEQCFEHMRHYDSISNSIITFSLTGYIAVFTGLYSIYQINSPEHYKYLFIIFLSLATLLAGFLFLMVFVRTKLYYTVVARQVNSLRRYFLENSELDFILYNKCYMDSDKPDYYSALSTYSLYLYLVCILNSSLFEVAVVVYYLKILQQNIDKTIFWGSIFTILVFVFQLIISIVYLNKRDKKSADIAVFGKKGRLQC